MTFDGAKMKKHLNTLIHYAILIILSLFVIVPILWMISTSFKSDAETYSRAISWIPEKVNFGSYKKFWGVYNFGRMIWNSFLTCLASMVICVIFASLAGYGVTRFNFKGKKQFMGFLLITQMFPGVMMVVPFYFVLSKYGLTNSLLGLTIVYAATNIAFSTWMMSSYFKTIPTDLDEAAKIDGASSFRTFWNIVLPITIPGIASVAIFVLINGWNDYMFSSVLMSRDSLKTLTVGIVSLNTQNQVYWNDMMAASTVSCIPLIVLFIFFQKYFIAGMSSGAIKS